MEGAARIAAIAAAGRPRRPGDLPDLRRRLRAAAAARRAASPSRRSRRPRGCCWPAAPTSTRSTPSASTSPRIKGGQLARLAAPGRGRRAAALRRDRRRPGRDRLRPHRARRLHLRAAPPASSTSTASASAFPAAVRDAHRSAACAARLPETPKPGDPLFRRVRNTVIGSNRLALDAAARRAPRAWATAPWCSPADDRGRDARDRAHARRHRPRDRAHPAGP